SGMRVTVGDYVIVPLGGRHVNGVVWGPPGLDVAEEKLKDIIGLLDLPRMTEGVRRFVDWVAAYTLSPPGAVLRMTMSVPSALDAPRTVTAYVARSACERDGADSRIRITPARRRVLDALTDDRPRPAAEIARATGVSASVVRGMAEAGLLRPVALAQRFDMPQPDWRRAGPRLSGAQGEAAAILVDAVQRSVAKPEDGFAVKLLDGVTGSGKTEVYF